MTRSSILRVDEPIAGQNGRIGSAWYRFFVHIERLITGAVTTPGTGLEETASGALGIADDGVSNDMLRESLPLSVIGNPQSSAANPQDIAAGGEGWFLQRYDSTISFRIPRLPSYTVAGVPSAAGVGAGTIAFISNEAGGATIAFSDGSSWRRVQDRAVIS